MNSCTQRAQQRAATQPDAAQTPDTPYICADHDGKLPNCAPLAVPFVPFQQTGANKYALDYALARGTLFEGLDLPYLGMQNGPFANMTALEQIQALGFALNELGLYLDTHANDTEAVTLYNQYAELYEEAVQQYQQAGNDLVQLTSAATGSYQWLRGPWPWDMQEEG